MQERNSLQAILATGLAYAAGFGAGTLLILLLLNNALLRAIVGQLDALQIFLKLLLTIFLILLSVGIGGAVAGAIGGWGLTRAHDLTEVIGARRRFTSRSAISFFVAHAVIIVPAILLTVVIGFLAQTFETNVTRLPILFGIYGLVYGTIAGLLLGLMTVGLRRTLGVWLAATAGFGLGGMLLGAVLFLLSGRQQPADWVSVLGILIGLTLFGLVGGLALGIAYRYVPDFRTLIPETRGWQLFRNVTLGFLALLVLIAVYNLVSTFIIRPATLADRLALPTQGVHWRAPDAPLSLPDAPDPALEAVCGPDGQVAVRVDGARRTPLVDANCVGETAVAADSSGAIHVVWTSPTATKATGVETPGPFVFESIDRDGTWTVPAIVARTSGLPALTLAPASVDSLGLIVRDESGTREAIYTPYDCSDVPLTPLGEAMLDVLRQERFRPATDPVPYCYNTYNRLLFTPNPTAPDTNAVPSPNGAFDDMAELVRSAHYEVLFTTMQWDKPSAAGSPGGVLATAVADLYAKVKANPDAYPRGMTVRILLGNIPELALFSVTSQVYHPLQDLSAAGLPTMVDEEIGWRVELANFDGQWPHAHSKFLVVDGETAVAAGFNYSYLHLRNSHPSGQGLSMTDKGISITGPLAQSVMSAYDDLWTGSDLVTCSAFPPPIPLLDFLWCDKQAAVATHPPEVLRFFVTDGDSNAFALHHTSVNLESDAALLAAIGAAQESLDIYEVNFSLETLCVLSVLLDGICTTDDMIPPYMRALVTAVVENDVQVRAIVEPSAMNGLENRIAIVWLAGELAKQGKLNNVAVKFSKNKMHDKALLIDDQLLIVGSQNFHWSAWDTPSLTEYNIATEAPDAIETFSREFEHQWEIGIPARDMIGDPESLQPRE